MTILVCDDDPHTRALHSHYLRKAGYRVLTAASAEDAFKRLELDDPRAEPEVELVLMDLMMPEMDGLEACRRIQASEIHRAVPIVFVSAAEPQGNAQNAYESGAIDFVAKPVDPEILLARIDALLSIKRDLDGESAPTRH